jgi:hypothetical protein
MMSELQIDGWPSVEKVMLPSRAFLLSWREQTLPTRIAAIDDAADLFAETVADGPSGRADMALLGLIAEAMQPLEDFAYLATAWTEPFGNLAFYVKATVYSGWTPSSFWQRIHKRDSDYFDALAGYSGINPATGAIEDVIENLGVVASLTEEVQKALARARAATQNRLRRLLGVLASDWGQFGDYFYAYKHGGLTVNRNDVAWIADGVTELTPTTPREVASLAAWHRGGKQMEGRGEFGLSASEIANTVEGTGRLAIDLCDAFVESRLAVFDAVEFGPDATIVALRPTQLPWTVWLREADLPPETWAVVGAGPRLTWAGAADDDRLPLEVAEAA